MHDRTTPLCNWLGTLSICSIPLRCRLLPSTERPDVRYSLVAVDFLPPAVIGKTLRKVAGRLSSGELRPLRHISHSMGSVAAAFRQMIQVGAAGGALGGGGACLFDSGQPGRCAVASC